MARPGAHGCVCWTADGAWLLNAPGIDEPGAEARRLAEGREPQLQERIVLVRRVAAQPHHAAEKPEAGVMVEQERVRVAQRPAGNGDDAATA